MSQFISSSHTRRSFLRTSTALLALPFLESIAQGKVSKARAPKRLVFLGGGYGFTKQTFYPSASGRFSKIGLTEGLSPLERHQDDISLISGLSNNRVGNPHAGSAGYLSAAPGKITCDQVAAQHIGGASRYPSLVLTARESMSAQNAGHGHGSMSLSWNHNGKPIAGFNTPLELYQQLFAPNNRSKSEVLNALKKQKSLLDIARLDVSQMKRTLCREDTEKLEEYFQGLREIEQNLERQAKWLDIPKPKPNLPEPTQDLFGELEIKTMFDMIITALQTDNTRVVSYRVPVTSLLRSLEININAHSLSHYRSSTTRTMASQLRDEKCMQLLAHFIDRLKQAKDMDGQRLYDNCIVSYGSNLRSGHELRNLPALLTGGGTDRIKHGRHIALPENTPLENYWLTLLREADIDIEQFNNSSGPIKQLYQA